MMSIIEKLEKGARQVVQELNEISDEQLEALWDLYTRAFEETAQKTPRPQPMTRDDFFELIRDKTIRKYIARRQHQLIGMLLLATDMSRTEFWISKPFLEQNFADEIKNKKMVYVLGIATDPELRREKPFMAGRAATQLVEQIIKITEEIGVCLQDFSPESTMDYPGFIERTLQNKFGNKFIEYKQLDSQIHGSFQLPSAESEKLSAQGELIEETQEISDEQSEEIWELYSQHYIKIDCSAVQPQSMSKEFFLEVIQDRDYIKTVKYDSSHKPKALLISTNKYWKPHGILNQAFIERKYGKDAQICLIVGLTGSDSDMQSMIRTRCLKIQSDMAIGTPSQNYLYYVGSKKAMEHHFQVAVSALGVTEDDFQLDGQQIYGVFREKRDQDL